MSASAGFRPGDVLDYKSDRPDRWCREGTAVVTERMIADTYWRSGDNHVLTRDELATATVLFNLDEFEEIAPYSRHAPEAWKNRAEVDRRVITAQHGLDQRWFIRKGSAEDDATIRANLVEEVRAATEIRDRAERNLAWARRALEEFDGRVLA